MRVDGHDGMILAGKTQNTRRKHVPVPLCPPQIPQRLGRKPRNPRGEAGTNSLSHSTDEDRIKIDITETGCVIRDLFNDTFSVTVTQIT
jgi:hypothetical protein